MMEPIKTISGQAVYIDLPNVDTDQIIPAKYLTGVSIQGLGPHLFEDLALPGFNCDAIYSKETVVLVTRENFGCGSSREHAVWALEANGFRVVIAPSFARIFRQNMFNRGLLAIRLSSKEIDGIFKSQCALCKIDFEKMVIFFGDKKYAFQISDFNRSLIVHSGLVGFVNKHY